MKKLTPQDLYSLEEYAKMRGEFRDKVMAHKKDRQVHLDDHLTLYFEDYLTMQYQVQEMLRAEKIFEQDGIKEELDTYNPLIPDGSNWKATFMIEYEDVEERQKALAKLIGIEKKIWIQVNGHDKVFAIADEDLERDTEEKTSAVHFMRFELTPEMAAAAKAGETISMGADHPGNTCQVDQLPKNTCDALIADLA